MSKIIGKLSELNIPSDNPFQEDKLGRSDCVTNLISLINNIDTSNGFVLGINGKWGSGKTTFVKMWERKLSQDGYDTIFINLWENDFVEDPLIVFISKLQQLQSVKEKAKNSVKNVIKEGGKLLLGMAGSTAKYIANKYIGEEASDILATGIQSGGDQLIKYIEDYQQQTKSIRDLKQALINLKNDLGHEKPLIFFIDELDRCKPSYAVKVLERMKHLFSVPGIVFVLSIDKKALSNAIRGYYGSELIDGEEYLRRFIDLEFQLPHPNPKTICNYLYNLFQLDKYIQENHHRKGYEYNRKLFLDWAHLIFMKKQLNLRQLEKIFAQASLALKTFSTTTIIRPEIIFLLIYLSVCETKLYNELKSGEMSINEMINEIGNIFPPNIFSNTTSTSSYSNNEYLFYGIGELIWIYNASDFGDPKFKLLSEEEGNESLLFDAGPYDENALLKIFKLLRSYEFTLGAPSMNSYIQHIEFVSLFQ